MTLACQIRVPAIFTHPHLMHSFPLHLYLYPFLVLSSSPISASLFPSLRSTTCLMSATRSHIYLTTLHKYDALTVTCGICFPPISLPLSSAWPFSFSPPGRFSQLILKALCPLHPYDYCCLLNSSSISGALILFSLHFLLLHMRKESCKQLILN